MTDGARLPGGPGGRGRGVRVQPPRPTLPAYDADKECPACGHYTVATAYCRGVVTQPHPDWLPWLLRLVWPTRRGPCRFDPYGRAHLHRTCDRCGYLWAERVVNEELEEVPA